MEQRTDWRLAELELDVGDCAYARLTDGICEIEAARGPALIRSGQPLY
jgi:hypothetical protein